MQTISDFIKYDKLIQNKIDSFSKNLNISPFFLLFKINTNFFKSELFESQLERLINAGLKNLEISWSDNKEWINYVSKIKLKFPNLNLGSASIINKKSIDESIKIGLDYSMMKFWDKDLLTYAKAKNHLLIPGINNIKDLREAIGYKCKIIKIYPVKNKDELINIDRYKNITFIAAGGLSIYDLQLYKSLGYKAIVIGNKVFNDNGLDPEIYKWLIKN